MLTISITPTVRPNTPRPPVLSPISEYRPQNPPNYNLAKNDRLLEFGPAPRYTVKKLPHKFSYVPVKYNESTKKSLYYLSNLKKSIEQKEGIKGLQGLIKNIMSTLTATKLEKTELEKKIANLEKKIEIVKSGKINDKEWLQNYKIKTMTKSLQDYKKDLSKNNKKKKPIKAQVYLLKKLISNPKKPLIKTGKQVLEINMKNAAKLTETLLKFPKTR